MSIALKVRMNAPFTQHLTILLTACCLPVAHGFAAAEMSGEDAAEVQIEPYVVVACTLLSLDGCSIGDLLSADEMEFWQDRTLTEAGRDPGITIRRNGAYGGVTSVFTRGTNSNHTGYFLDGRRLPIAFSGQFNAESLALNNLESVQFRKERLRSTTDRGHRRCTGPAIQAGLKRKAMSVWRANLARMRPIGERSRPRLRRKTGA